MHYEVTSNRDLVVDGLGALKKDEPTVFTVKEAGWYQILRGVPLRDENLPEGVTVAVTFDTDKGE